jgi:hypothetical protein
MARRQGGPSHNTSNGQINHSNTKTVHLIIKLNTQATARSNPRQANHLICRPELAEGSIQLNLHEQKSSAKYKLNHYQQKHFSKQRVGDTHWIELKLNIKRRTMYILRLYNIQPKMTQYTSSLQGRTPNTSQNQ